MSTNDQRRFAPAVARNREPILELLRRVLPERGTVLEIASGTGEHAVFFALSLPGLTWEPSDPDAGARASVAAWIAERGAGNVLPPLALDASAPDWPPLHADAIVAINMIHIAPWAATPGLFGHGARLLDAGRPLVLYGPFRRGFAHTAPSNEAFDADLRARNPDWGVRDLEAVTEIAVVAGFALDETIEMPANNLGLVFRRRPGVAS